MLKKKWTCRIVLVLVLTATLLTFLWPRSFLSNVEAEIHSISVNIIENSLEHYQETQTFNVGDPEFEAIMEILNRYSYHVSKGTIYNLIKQTAHIEGNDAGYWLQIYLYTEPDCYGDLYSITSGGTGEIIFDHGVYRMGYWGNKTARKFMDEVYQVVNP